MFGSRNEKSFLMVRESVLEHSGFLRTVFIKFALPDRTEIKNQNSSMGLILSIGCDHWNWNWVAIICAHVFYCYILQTTINNLNSVIL